jgi:hypothetical protein
MSGLLRSSGGGGCCSKPPLGGWRGRSLLGVEYWKWRSASQWRLLQCGYHLHMSMSPCFRVHVSMSPCLHVSMSPCLHVSVSMSPCACLYVSIYPCFHVYVSMAPCLRFHISMFPEFRKRKTELTENGKFRLFATNGKWKRYTSVCLLQKGNGKREFVFLDRQKINGIDDCCFVKPAHLFLNYIIFINWSIFVPTFYSRM